MDDEIDGYRRVILSSTWDGLIGPSSHTAEVVAWECTDCYVLTMDTEGHDRWHNWLNSKLAAGERAFSRTRSKESRR